METNSDEKRVPNINYRVIDGWKGLDKYARLLEYLSGETGEASFERVLTNDPSMGTWIMTHGIMTRIEVTQNLAQAESPAFFDTVFLLKDICDDIGLEIKSLGRACVNFSYPIKGEEIQSAPHVDHSFPNTQILIFLNDTDGDTILYEDKMDYGDPKKKVNMTSVPKGDFVRISPKKGRIVIFDGSHYHTGFLPTEKERIVLVATVI